MLFKNLVFLYEQPGHSSCHSCSGDQGSSPGLDISQSCLLVFRLIKISITTRKKSFRLNPKKNPDTAKTWTRLDRIKPDYKWIKLSLSRLICVSVSAHWNRSKKVLEAFFRDISRDGWILFMLFSCIVVWQRGRGVSAEQKWHDWTKILHLWPFVVVRPSALT